MTAKRKNYRPNIEDEDKSIRKRVSVIVNKTDLKTYALEKKIFKIGLLAIERDLEIVTGV